MPENYAATQRKVAWAARFKPLIGRTITKIGYLTQSEMNRLGWYASAFVIQLDDGTLLYPSADDEGNGAGALFTQAGSKTAGLEPIAPVIR